MHELAALTHQAKHKEKQQQPLYFAPEAKFFFEGSTNTLNHTAFPPQASSSTSVLRSSSSLMAKPCVLLLLLAFALSSSLACARQFEVGGSRGWSLPDPDAMSYNQWAQRNRFHVGDSLLFVYPKHKDSVLEVDKNSYDACNTSTYIEKYDDGNTVFTITRSGAFYFISGVESNCLRNESLVILVMANRTNRHQLGPSSPPAEAPTPSSSYPPPPSEALEPSPSPSSPPSPPSPPPSPSEVTPAPEPAPAGEEPNNPPPPPPNGAALRVAGLVGLVGPLLGPAIFFFL